MISWLSTWAITASRGWKTIFLPRYLPMWRIISTTPWISPARSVRSRWMSSQREKSSSFSVMLLQRNASSWIIRR